MRISRLSCQVKVDWFPCEYVTSCGMHTISVRARIKFNFIYRTLRTQGQHSVNVFVGFLTWSLGHCPCVSANFLRTSLGDCRYRIFNNMRDKTKTETFKCRQYDAMRCYDDFIFLHFANDDKNNKYKHWKVWCKMKNEQKQTRLNYRVRIAID